MQRFGKVEQFKIWNNPFPVFDSTDCLLVLIQTRKLKLGGELFLRQSGCFPELFDFKAGCVRTVIFVFV